MYRFFLLLIGLAGLAQLPAQDSLSVDISPVTVQAFRGETDVARVAGSVATLGAETINEYPAGDLLPAMNRIPGVRFEQRAPGSYRISVRGSTLRAPFGVRNVKVYWNGIPLTEPGGDTQLNFLDVANVDRLELIKGPAGSLYGAGTAGTLLLSTDSLRAPIGAEMTAGSFEFRRARAQVQWGRGIAKQQLRYAYQVTDGYRDHSSLERHNLQYSLNLGQARHHSLNLHALYTNLSYDLPGGLDAEQLAADPTQARPGSAETNASINYHNILLGLTREWTRGDWSNQSSVYATAFYFDHPFNFDYKRETNLGGGARTTFDRDVYLDRGSLKFSLGAEYQYQFRMANNFENDATQPGELNFSDEIDSWQGLLFGQVRFATLAGWRLTAGLSVNTLRYEVDRTFPVGQPLVESDIPVEVSPRLAALRTFGPVNVYASIARGFSPPTLDEFRTNEGSLNVGLEAERGTNYELGVKGRAGALTYEVTGFYFRLSQTITTFSDARDTRLFRNAGDTDQFGLEVAANWRLNAWLNGYASYTYHDFNYGTFLRDGLDVSGNRLPGTAPHVANLIFDVGYERGLYASLNWNYTDAIPLNDAGTVFGEAYHLVRARVGWRRGGCDIFLTGSNLLDERMSFGNDLNPRFGNRYFQPAPGVSGAVGARFGIYSSY